MKVGVNSMNKPTSNKANKSSFVGFRFHIITRRELEKIFTLPYILIFLIVAIIVPFLVAFLWANDANVKDYPLDIQALMLRDYLFFVTYFWLAGIVLAFFASWIVTDFVAGEVSRGTLLSLITRPIHRWEVILGKFIAYMIFITIMEVIAIFITIYVLVTFSGAHISVIGELVQYIPILLLFSLFVALVFGTIPLVLSTISKSRVLVMIIMATLVIIMYLGFYIIRARNPDFYVDFHLYHFDLGYHMGNIFNSFIETANIKLTPTFQELMGLFAGTHDLGVSLEEPDQGFQLASIPLTNYYSRLVSWLIWTLVPLGLSILTIFQLNRKEVQ
jgi:ABC-type transport system involved in multi-copper enzyme maturation permease subunit